MKRCEAMLEKIDGTFEQRDNLAEGDTEDESAKGAAVE